MKDDWVKYPVDGRKEGSIIPIPLIVLGVAIAFPAVVMGAVIERMAKWVMSWGKKETWI